jgi:NSS family neurotransmitter:Na+ symporter
MIIPAVIVFMGPEGMTSGPGLMFIALPKVFRQMGTMGTVVGIVFFLMVLMAALTSSISIEEAVVSSFMDHFHMDRKKATLIETAIAVENLIPRSPLHAPRSPGSSPFRLPPP